MTIGNSEIFENHELKKPVSSEFADMVLRQLSPEERQSLIDKHNTHDLPVVVEDVPENKLAGLNYQEYGLTELDFLFVGEYFANGFNGKQAYMSVQSSVTPESAAVRAHQVLNKSNVKKFLSAVLDAMGMSNVELERRLEVLISADPMDAFDMVGDTLTFNLERARRLGVTRLIKGIKQTRYGVEVSFVPIDKLLDIATKVRGMQKKVAITGKLEQIAEGTPHDISKLQALTEFLTKKAKPTLLARDQNNGIEIYQSDE